MTTSQLGSFGTPILAGVLFSLFSVVALGLFMANARAAALLLFVVILSFVNASYGYLAPPEFSVYSKGSKTLFFPLIQFYLYGLFLATCFQNAFQNRAVMSGAGKGWMLAFSALFAGHVAYGLAAGASWSSVLSWMGLINVVHMSMIAYVVVSVLRHEDSFVMLTRSLLVVAVASALYGLARFVFFGGDPQNAYANYEGLNLKITYWDINEGLIAALVVFYCVGRLLREWSTSSHSTRAFWLSASVVELFVVLFSYRRTNWYGFVLAGLYLAWLLPTRKRTVTGLVFVLLVPPVVYLSTQREEQILQRGTLSLIERIAPDVGAGGGVVEREARLYELYTAFDSVKEHPLLGVGAWGEFEVGVSAAGLEYHRGNYGFIHSGLGHVLLKSGLLGLVLFCGILLSAWRYASRARPRIPGNYLALFESCKGGVIFLVPDLLFGTPIIEFRTMALLGVLLAVPVAIAGVAVSEGAKPGSGSRPAMRRATRPFVDRTARPLGHSAPSDGISACSP